MRSKKTICGIPLDDVLTNVKAGIEEEGMNARVVKILDTSDVCFMAHSWKTCQTVRFRNRHRHPVQRNDHDHSPERSLSALQSGIVSTGAADGPRYLPKDRTERRQIRQRRTGCARIPRTNDPMSRPKVPRSKPP